MLIDFLSNFKLLWLVNHRRPKGNKFRLLDKKAVMSRYILFVKFRQGSTTRTSNQWSTDFFESIKRELKQPQRRQRQICIYHNEKKFFFSTFCTSDFVFLNFSNLLSFNLRRAVTCFAIMWTTWALAYKFSVFSANHSTADNDLIAGY